MENRTRDERVREEVVDEEDPLPPNPGSCVCTEVAPFGYHGPSIVGRGTTLADIDCPEDATLPGFSGIVVATGQWARECRITPLPICALSGLVCAPAPPAGFSLCIYRGEAISCPDGYRNAEPVIETDGLQPLKNVTLCCADPAVPE